MAWENSDRRSRLPKDWEQTRKRILGRDGHKCRWRIGQRLCNAFANQVDHIKAGDDDSDSNLQALCETHHTYKSSQEGGRARAARVRAAKQRLERPVEKHYVPPAKEAPKTIGY